MPESIFKLQPDRTIALRGFDTFAAAACVHSASPTSFRVSGTFRDPADFTVAVLYDADNFYEHPYIKYLPDFNFAGLTLNFDLNYSDGMQPIDSPKYNWIDWATLDCILENGNSAKIRLWDNSTLVDAQFPAASVTCNVLTIDDGIQAFDRITLWYQNLAFDYIVPVGKGFDEFSFYVQGTNQIHSITINGTIYAYTEVGGEESKDIANALVKKITDANDPYVTAAIGKATNNVLLKVQKTHDGLAIPVSYSDGAIGGIDEIFRYTSAAFAAAQVVSQVNVTDWNSAGTPHALMASSTGTAVTLTAARYGFANVSGTSVTSTTINPSVPPTVFAGITAGSPILIGGTICTVASVDSPLHLTLVPSKETSTFMGTGAWVAPRGGRDGNLIGLYSLAKTDTLRFDQASYQMAGGSSDVTWNCNIDFSALGIDRLRQCWLTFAPALVVGPYPVTEWEAVFSNWQVSGPPAVRALQVAGPGSVRIEQSDLACAYNGTWSIESGFYSRYFANVAKDATASVTITYTCNYPHDLWIGTSLYSDRSDATVQLDGGAEQDLTCQLSSSSAVVTRRQAQTGIAAGRHTVVIRPATANPFYFNFLEAVVATDVPDAIRPRTGISPALDFDTDHTYKLSPGRLMWILDKLGYQGPMNEYLGVFWWNQRKLIDAVFSSATVTFSGTFEATGAQTIDGTTVDIAAISLTLGQTLLSKTVLPEDTPETIATHFAAMINGGFVGVWASASGSQLTITGRSAGPDYAVDVKVVFAAGGNIDIVPSQAAQYGTWVIDDTVNPPLNRAARDWHADFYAQCAGREREVVTACSMELVYPPAGFAALFPDGTPVTTATGFGTLVSNHCAIGNSQVLAYQKAVYRCIAGLQAAAGLTPCVQYGELLWWYLTKSNSLPGNGSKNTNDGMAFYDAETVAAANIALGGAPYTFNGQDEDPNGPGAATALFLRNRLRDHLATLISDIRSVYPNAICELLWPYDVNYPTQFIGGSPPIGGSLNRFVNLPAEWQTPATCTLDRIKVEALAFASGMRNLDLSREAVGLFPSFGWPVDRLRYLVPVFGFACPWNRELALAYGVGITTNNLWAFDHVCLFNLDVPERALERRSFIKAA